MKWKWKKLKTLVKIKNIKLRVYWRKRKFSLRKTSASINKSSISSNNKTTLWKKRTQLLLNCKALFLKRKKNSRKSILRFRKSKSAFNKHNNISISIKLFQKKTRNTSLKLKFIYLQLSLLKLNWTIFVSILALRLLFHKLLSQMMLLNTRRN